MNRRAFLSTLVTGSAAMVLDPELALWRPGAKTFFLPSPQTIILSKKQTLTITLPPPQAGLVFDITINGARYAVAADADRTLISGPLRVIPPEAIWPRLERILPSPIYIDPDRTA